MGFPITHLIGPNSPPPPDSFDTFDSPPPPSSESPPPPDNSPPPPTPSPPPPSPDATPPPNPTPPPPSPPSPPSTPSEPSPPANPPPTAPPADQYKSPDAPPHPLPGNEPPGSGLSPPFEAPPHSNLSPPSHTTNPKLAETSKSDSTNSSVAVVVGISVAGVLILAVIIACLLCNRKRKKRPHYYDNERPPNDWNKAQNLENGVKLPPAPQNGPGNGQWGAPPAANYSGEYNQSYNSGQYPPSPMGGRGFSSQSQFSYDDLAAATSGFSQANLLGQGGFGYVHKGVLPDGKVVAVKSLKSGSGQGEREFQAEVDIISRVHHRHLVSLVGYCIAESQRMLVYEFVSNSTMEHHLHGKGQPVMDWSSRVRIAIGSSKGLAYLHEDCHPRIIHRDIKAANILLDDNYEAMVADFGLAKLTTDNFTHVSTRVMGTFGYLAPEYASSGKLSEKSDVFSFGVMLLELITGRPPVDLTGEVMDDSLVDWARPLLAKALEDGDYSELADPRMEGNYDPQQMASMISCAAGSIRHSAKRRPRMSHIMRALEGESLLAEETSDIPKRARSANGSATLSASSANGSIGGSTTSHDSIYDTVAYNADMMKFKKMVLTEDDE